MILCEIISRSMKDVLFEVLRNVENYMINDAITHVLNLFFGYTSSPSKDGPRFEDVFKATKISKKEQKLSQIPRKTLVFNLTTFGLWTKIKQLLVSKYRYEMPEELPDQVFTTFMLRLICTKVGIQIRPKNYDLQKANPFHPADIIQLYAVMKYSMPVNYDGKELLDASKLYLQDSERLDISFELVNESLSICHQVYGIEHLKFNIRSDA